MLTRWGDAQVTTGSTHLNFAGADSAPGLRPLVEGLARRFGEHGQGKGGEYDVGTVEMGEFFVLWRIFPSSLDAFEFFFGSREGCDPFLSVMRCVRRD